MKLSGKGGMRIDRIAHTIMEFDPSANANGTTRKDGYTAFYHEESLYSVRDIERGTVTLVYAGNPYEAIEKLKR